MRLLFKTHEIKSDIVLKMEAKVGRWEGHGSCMSFFYYTLSCITLICQHMSVPYETDCLENRFLTYKEFPESSILPVQLAMHIIFNE